MLDSNGFWVFLGIVVGAIVQFIFHRILQWEYNRKARKLLKIEVDINKDMLKRLEEQLIKTKARISSGQIKENDLYINFSDFIYRMADPLINSGHFYSLLDAEGVKAYFKFVSELNHETARNHTITLKERHNEKRSMEYMEYLIDTKFIEWKGWLEILERKLN